MVRLPWRGVLTPVLSHSQLLALDVADGADDVVVEEVLQDLVLLSLPGNKRVCARREGKGQGEKGEGGEEMNTLLLGNTREPCTAWGSCSGV